MQEFKAQKTKLKATAKQAVKPIKLSEIKAFKNQRIATSLGEFDRVLGGGFIAGSVVLLAGEPGVGKSTLLLQLVKFLPKESICLYICGEESPEQVKLRAERTGAENSHLLLLPETNVERIIEEAAAVAEGLLVQGEAGKIARDAVGIFMIIDSIQTLWSEDFDGSPGSISQVRGCSQKLLEFAKKNSITAILVGHVNKEGEIAGPMILSHMVDAVLFLEGERFADLRLLRGIKNRFGPTDEVGVFRMGEKGMTEVANPSELFLEAGEETKNQPGSVVVCAMEGTRPVLLEIQALVTQSALAVPRRVVSGVDYNRVLLLAAVLQKTLGLPLYNQDIFVKVGGGFKIAEPAADLGICLAIVSSFKNTPLLVKACVFGEVGLLGEIRRVSGEEKRIKEAKKLGFTKILSSGTIKSLREAVKIVGELKGQS